MPELPEVETYRQYLVQNVIGRQIIQTTVYVPKILKDHTPNDFAKKLRYETIRKIIRHGKYLLFLLNRFAMIVHLRMEGKLFVKNSQQRQHNHLVIEWKLDNKQYLQFLDSRKFATIHLVKLDQYQEHYALQKVGLDPFAPNMNVDYLHQAWTKRKVDIKTLLLEQSIISGIGNIYANEILFLSRIHPQVRVNHLTKFQIKSILQQTRAILHRAITLGGTTVRSYYVNHKQGDYFKLLQVYDRQKLPCYVCQTPIVKIKLKQRGTYFCPKCQKM